MPSNILVLPLHFTETHPFGIASLVRSPWFPGVGGFPAARTLTL